MSNKELRLECLKLAAKHYLPIKIAEFGSQQPTNEQVAENLQKLADIYLNYVNRGYD